MRPRQVLTLIIGVKASLLLLVWLLATFNPTLFNARGYFENFHWSLRPSFETWFQTWDGMHYLFIAKSGYQAGSPVNAFSPLWPFLIRIGSFFSGGHFLIAALFLSNVFSALGFWFIHSWIRQKDARLADTTLLLLLAYPGSLFFMFPYSESLFFFLSVVFFIFLSKRQYTLVAWISFFLPLTRLVGIFSAVPFACQLAKDKIAGKSAITTKVWLLLAAPLGVLCYFIMFQFITGDALAGIRAQHYYIGGRTGANLFNLVHFVQEYLNVSFNHDFTHSWVDRFWFTVFLVSFPAIWKYNQPMFYYALALGLFPVMTGSFMSFTRYLSVIFPFFIVWANFFNGIKRRYFLPPVLTILFGFQIYFLIRHVCNYWVG